MSATAHKEDEDAAALEATEATGLLAEDGDAQAPAPPAAAGAGGAAGTASAMLTRTATFLSAAKDRVGGAVAAAAESAAQMARQVVPRSAPAAPQQPASGAGAPATQDDVTDLGAPPAAERQPSALEQVVDKQHGQAVLLANSIIDFSSEVSRKVEASVVKTRENAVATTWRTYQAAVQGLRRLTAPSRRVAAVVKADLRTKPVPQVLLLTCNLVATKGLSTTNLFQAPHPPPETVAMLTQRLEDRLLLLPSDLDPAVAAGVIVHFLETLEEPLLTFKLVDRWVAVGKQLGAPESGGADGVHELLSNLPLANWSTLKLLVETLYRVASQSNITGMNAQSLSLVFAPVLAWREHAPPPQAPAATSASGSVTGVAPKAGSGSTGTSSAQVVVAQASQFAANTLQAIKSKVWAPTPASTGADAGTPTAASGGPAADGAAVVTASAGEEPPLPASEPTVPPPRAPHMVLDEDEEDPSEVSKQEAANLEKSISQHVNASKADAEEATSPTAAAAVAATAPAASADGVKPKVVLQDDELQAVATVLTHVIMDFDNLFVLGP